ncbi:hypothetical protein [Tomitella biformata]|uniref:hypothetical protein n=1 Tax=Tomitella biformata TaxID=630403 RepID=UPI00046692FC|nr:hypothetical protein [Tomitella biformata]
MTENATDEQRIDAARAYLDALVSHDGTAVPLAEKAVRIEAGLKTGFSGNHIRRSLTRGPQFRVIGGIRELECVAKPGVIETHYLLDTNVFGLNLVVAEISELFFIPEDGLIHRIEAKIKPRLGPSLRR